MRKLFRWLGIGSARKDGRVRRVFRKNGVEMRGQLQKMGEMNQVFVSVSAVRH